MFLLQKKGWNKLEVDRIESEEKGSGGESGEHLEQNPICLREQVRMQQKGHLKSPDGVFFSLRLFQQTENTEKIRRTNFSSDCSVCYVLKQFISSSNRKEVVSLVPGSRISQLFHGKTNCDVWFPEVCRFCLTLRVSVMDGGQLEPPEE